MLRGPFTVPLYGVIPEPSTAFTAAAKDVISGYFWSFCSFLPCCPLARGVSEKAAEKLTALHFLIQRARPFSPRELRES